MRSGLGGMLAGLALVAGGTTWAQETAAQPAAGGDGLHPRVRMVTTVGDIVLELDGEKAPITVDNFMQYVEANFYDGLIFHRVMPDFMIQGGGFSPDMDEKKDGQRPPIQNEWKNGLKNDRGSISMARTAAPDSATAQFFINVVNNDRLNGDQNRPGYAVFGKVVEGMEVVDKIKDTETIEHPKLPMGKVAPKEAIVIKDVEVVVPLDRSKVSGAIEQAKADAAARKAEAQAKAAEKWKARWPEDVKAFVAKQEQELGKPATVKPSGLTYFVLSEGSGELPAPTDFVMAHYLGTFVNGEKFDSSYERGQPYKVSLQGGVIRGWLEALAEMKQGEKRKLIIPPSLAYGKQGRPGIPPDSWLVFEVEAVEIVKP